MAYDHLNLGRAGARPYPLVLAVVPRPSVPALPVRSPVASGERLMLASPRFFTEKLVENQDDSDFNEPECFTNLS